MNKQLQAIQKKIGIEPYWYFIILFSIGAIALYSYHLATGETPSRSAVRINAFDLDIYWYGFLIIGGVALGTYVTARLALVQARRVFEDHVPLKLRSQPLSEMKLPAEIRQLLNKRDIQTMGDLLFQWGLHPERLGLNRAGTREAQKVLEDNPAVEAEWVTNAPWRIWNPDYAWNGVTVCLILAIIGARLYHVLTPSPSMADLGIHSFADYLQKPWELVNLRNGGLGIYGGIIGGAVGLLWYTRRNRLPTIAWADLGVVGVALGQFMGRWGNFFNQELYGRPSNLPWAVRIDEPYRLPGYETIETFQPAFLYESLWNFLSFVILLFLARRYPHKLQTGDLMALYLVQYAIGRILLEFVRLDSRVIELGSLGIPVATLVSLGVALPMAVLLIWRHLLVREKN